MNYLDSYLSVNTYETVSKKNCIKLNSIKAFMHMKKKSQVEIFENVVKKHELNLDMNEVDFDKFMNCILDVAKCELADDN